MHPHEAPAVLAMMRRLWPDCDDTTIVDDAVLVVARDGSTLGGFLALSLRPWAEGCTSTPCAYIEGWWVDDDLRGQGWGRRLVEAAEAWALAHGSAELASDAELANTGSIAAHAALGFDEVQRTVAFKKRLANEPRARSRERHVLDHLGLVFAVVGRLAAIERALDYDLRPAKRERDVEVPREVFAALMRGWYLARGLDGAAR